MANLNQGKGSITAALDAVIANFEQIKKRFQQGMQQRRGDQLAARALAALKTVPGKPIHPIRWTSARQRRAFFASKGFGRGIPAERSNPPEVTEGWSVEFVPTDDGGIIALSNPVEHMKYLQGDQAQGFHMDTGWVQVDDVVQDFFAESEGAVVEIFFDAADPLQGL